MSHSYQAVGWNRQKKIYDLVILIGVFLYIGIFLGIGLTFFPNATAETLIIRAFGTGAFVLLHIILMIGPLSRRFPSLLPLLYNRRHLGVTMFLMALVHGAFSILQFHAFGELNPIVSVFISNGEYDSITQFPFQSLGLLALMILFVMAATSHDFWLANLTTPVWKALHMLVYVAYALISIHVILGSFQTDVSSLYHMFLGVGFSLVFTSHILVGLQEKEKDKEIDSETDHEGYIKICSVSEIPEKCAHIATLSGERVAIFNFDGKIAALSNVCQHQNGPLGEGKIVDGYVTCPWHGFQYRPEDGASPEPFTEKVPTFKVKVINDVVWVHPIPNLPGTHQEPVKLEKSSE
jgi:nitrite reductase/ring-hydroxylating ferredoxin subunit/DMSO/TMAO reductase YedYZ heme-binding membrane subunit